MVKCEPKVTFLASRIVFGELIASRLSVTPSEGSDVNRMLPRVTVALSPDCGTWAGVQLAASNQLPVPPFQIKLVTFSSLDHERCSSSFASVSTRLARVHPSRRCSERASRLSLGG